MSEELYYMEEEDKQRALCYMEEEDERKALLYGRTR